MVQLNAKGNNRALTIAKNTCLSTIANVGLVHMMIMKFPH